MNTELKNLSQNHTTIFFSDNLLAIEMERTWILMNKPVNLGLSNQQNSNVCNSKIVVVITTTIFRDITAPATSDPIKVSLIFCNISSFSRSGQ